MWQLYLTCTAIALIGMALQVALKLKSLQEKAAVSNAEFNVGMYFKYDWVSLLCSVLTIALFLFFLKDAVEKYPNLLIIKLLFGFIGYTGADVASRLFSVVNKRLNHIIDLKTNVSDKVSPSAAPQSVDTKASTGGKTV